MFRSYGLAFLAILLFGPRGSSQTSEVPPLVSVCEALADPLKYNGRLIRLRGLEVGTSEGVWLRGQDCAPIEASGRTWQPIIARIEPGLARTLRALDSEEARSAVPVDFDFDVASMEALIAKYQQLRRQFPDRCLESTYTGLFETRTDWSQFRVTYADGQSRVFGYGHLGDAPAQLIVKSADDITVIQGCQ